MAVSLLPCGWAVGWVDSTFLVSRELRMNSFPCLQLHSFPWQSFVSQAVSVVVLAALMLCFYGLCGQNCPSSHSPACLMDWEVAETQSGWVGWGWGDWKSFAQIRALLGRLKNWIGQAAMKPGLMPLTNEGLKVKELLSASRMNGRYLCLSGKQAVIPLEAEPSAASSPHPYEHKFV